MSISNQLLSTIDYNQKMIDLENRVKILESENKEIKRVCENLMKTTDESIQVVQRAEKTLFKAVKLIKEQKQIIDNRDDY